MKTLAQLVLIACCSVFSVVAYAQSADDHIVRQSQSNLIDFKNTGTAGSDPIPSRIDIPLFDGNVAQLQLVKLVERTPDDISWFGSVIGVENGSAILVVKDGNITGRIDINGSLYRISPVSGDLHSISEEDISLLPTLENDVHDLPENAGQNLNSPTPLNSVSPLAETESEHNDGSTAAPGDPEIFDVLAVYSTDALARYGDVEARIQLAVDYTNEAYENSLIPHRVNLVAIEPLNLPESGRSLELNYVNDLLDGRLDFVHDLRLQHNADIISIWVDQIEDFCGLASTILSRVENATHMTRVSCGGATFAHEIGHTQGARHNLEQDRNPIPFEYGHGSGSPTSQWRSIMSYTNACDGSPCTRIPYFSSPLLTYEGESLGDARYRDNARVITETGEDVADWSDYIFPDGAESVSVEYPDGSLAMELVEQFPGIWVGEMNMDEGLESVFLNVDGVRLGEASDYAVTGASFNATLAAGSALPIELLMWTDNTPMIFKFVERYNHLRVDHGFFAKESMYLRGTPNDFRNDVQMVHYGYDYWVGEMTFTGERNDRFKFDVYGDWQENYGLGEQEGTVESFGPDIPVPEPGTYRIYLRASSMQYWMVRQPRVNQAPVANAGEDFTAAVGQTFSFDGSDSEDPDGVIASYSWSPVGLSGESPEYVFDEVGTYTVILTVTDSDGAVSTDEVVVTVQEEISHWRRTVIFIYGRTNPGQDMFIRGGLDHAYANGTLDRGCTRTNYRCSIPIRYLSLRNPNTAPWKENDTYLDWYGLEVGQTGGSGSPLDWTTNQWGADWGPVKTYEVEGVGETPMNEWGSHYWIFEVEMDCSATLDGWFEFKSYISNGPGWENNLRQPGAPYTSNNHFGECGKLNVFRRNSSTPVTIEDF